MKTTGFLTGVLILLCIIAKAQAIANQPGPVQPGAAQPYVAWVKHYSAEDGLAHREVNAIFQDRQGFMWFGTKFGLSRFDGKNFTNFTKDRDGLAFDDIQSIAQDAEGWLWLMGPFGESRISLFNPLTGTTIPFEKKFGKKHVSNDLNISQRLFSSPDGTIFFANQNPAILSYYHPKSGLKHIRLPRFTKQITIRQVTARNTVWAIADGNNLIELNKEGRVIRQFTHAENLTTNCFGQRNADTEFFYLVANRAGGLAYTFYSIDESGRRSELPRAQQPAMPQNLYPLCYAFDKTGLIWDGIRLRDSTGVVLLDVTDQLSGEAVINRSFFVDKNGSMWLGTSFGVYEVKVAPNYFRRLFYNATYTGEKTAAIRGISVFGDTVYANFEKFGLFTSSPSGESGKKLFNEKKYSPMGALVEHPPGRIMLSSGSQLIDYERKAGNRVMFKFPGNVTIWAIHPFGAGQWIAGGRLGLWLVNLKTTQVESFRQYNQFQELAQSHVLYIAPDRENTFWICSGTGLYIIDRTKGITARYWSGGKGRFYLPADAYQHFYQDKKGIYWLGTANSGLIRWDRSQNNYRQFRRMEGLSNDNIHAIYPDKRGHLWLSSDYGVMQFDPTRLTTRTYFTQDGITHNEFNRISHFQDKTGKIYFGGLNGVTAFDPGDFENEKPPAPMQMRVVSFRQYDNESGQLNDKTEELARTHEVIIRPGEQTAVIDFAMLNFTDAEKNVYAYQFKGLDNTWTQQTESSLRLGNLPYGTYKLLIKAQAANGQWSANTLTIGVDVRRPFYLQAWFLILAVLLLIAGIWGWLKWRIWNHRHEQILLQAQISHATARIEKDKKVIERQAESLHQLNETKSRFFANISHEFRTPLTVILGMTSELKRYKPDEVVERSTRVADLIERNGSSLLRLINQILDLSKLEAGEMSWQPVQADLVTFTRYVAESFDTMANVRNIEVHFHSDEEFLETDFDKDKLQDILSNLLTNAIKFTPAGGQVYLQLASNEKSFGNNGYYEAISPVSHPGDQWISIHVRNTGQGIMADKLPLIFDRFFQVSNETTSGTGGTGIGLSLVRELVALAHGGLAVRSVPGEGAEFIIRFRRTCRAPKVLMQHFESVAGRSGSPDLTTFANETTDEKPILLLVEDNDDVATYIISAISSDYQIIRAENGQTGIDLALEIIPDLILTDVMMPLKDGYQLCDMLKNNPATSHIPIVMLTARAAISDRISGLRRGADAYLTKPFQREELEVLLSNLLQSRRRLQAYYSQHLTESPDSGLLPVEENESQENLFLNRLRSALEAQWGNNPLPMETIYQEIGMSRSSLHRKLTALTGMSVTRFDRSLRMTQARHLLTTSVMAISEVAYAVGFEDPKYFSRLFSEEFAQSPTEFRRLKQ